MLDLRDNGGGYLNAAIDVSSKFVAVGPDRLGRGARRQQHAVRRREHGDSAQAARGAGHGYTASASEITSGAIQDNGVGELIGTQTFGKGVVQTIHPLPDGSAVKITSARYLTPRGRDINTVGIEPDIKAPDPLARAARRPPGRHAIAGGRHLPSGPPRTGSELTPAQSLQRRRVDLGEAAKAVNARPASSKWTASVRPAFA